MIIFCIGQVSYKEKLFWVHLETFEYELYDKSY